MIGEERAADRKRKRDASPIAATPAKLQVMNNRQTTLVVPSAPTLPKPQENRKPEDTTTSWLKHVETYEDVFGLNEIFECLKPVNRSIAAAVG